MKITKILLAWLLTWKIMVPSHGHKIPVEKYAHFSSRASALRFIAKHVSPYGRPYTLVEE